MIIITCQTFIKAIFIHCPINVEVLSSHQGELCLGMLIRPIIRIVTSVRKYISGKKLVPLYYTLHQL